MPEHEAEVQGPGRVDIATDPDLGRRVSALHYAGRALNEKTSGGVFGNSATKPERNIGNLLTVADWLLNEHQPIVIVNQEAERDGPMIDS